MAGDLSGNLLLGPGHPLGRLLALLRLRLLDLSLALLSLGRLLLLSFHLVTTKISQGKIEEFTEKKYNTKSQHDK